MISKAKSFQTDAFWTCALKVLEKLADIKKKLPEDLKLTGFSKTLTHFDKDKFSCLNQAYECKN